MAVLNYLSFADMNYDHRLAGISIFVAWLLSCRRRCS